MVSQIRSRFDLFRSGFFITETYLIHFNHSNSLPFPVPIIANICDKSAKIGQFPYRNRFQ